jgi:D-cysteine desulfhydrase family pyridoxal phosphate-dependent enzyme
VDLRTRLARFPKVGLAHAPTPLEPLPRLSRALGGPEIWIKRDDCTGLATGGNKARKLDYLLADALAQEADTIVTTGALQSNHARQTAAAAARLGLRCILVLTDSVPGRAPEYRSGGNLLLDDLFGAEIRVYPGTADGAAAMAEVATSCEAAGRRPYVVPVGGSNAIGALGYVEAAAEILEQAAAGGVTADHLVVASGSGGTHAGLLIGIAAAGAGRCRVTGFGIGAPREAQAAKVRDILSPASRLLGLDAATAAAAETAIEINDRFVGPGYGQPHPAMSEAVRLVAQTEGLLLDPVYTGKAMAGLIDYVRHGRFRRGETVIFLHTGGSIGLFAYPDVFAAPADRAVPRTGEE